MSALAEVPPASGADIEYDRALIACRRILAKLQTLSDAPTAQLREGPRPPKFATTRVPDGVDLHRILAIDQAPAKPFSLYAHYYWHIVRARNASNAAKLWSLARQAQRDYEMYVGLRRPSRHEWHEHAVQELLENYRGVAAYEAADWLDQNVSWVERQRVVNGYSREFGEPRPQLAGERDQRCIRMANDGCSVRVIAAEVGLSKSRVSQILRGHNTGASGH